ncbi:Uncharacterized protein Fot_35271 [Forsythia ovata]|uniref:Uncharacterized protein n=1 Tax=Forsythia ovata TaxID=205694 RepID=A0ABD1SL26_9LAMI
MNAAGVSVSLATLPHFQETRFQAELEIDQLLRLFVNTPFDMLRIHHSFLIAAACRFFIIFHLETLHWSGVSAQPPTRFAMFVAFATAAKQLLFHTPHPPLSSLPSKSTTATDSKPNSNESTKRRNVVSNNLN